MSKATSHYSHLMTYYVGTKILMAAAMSRQTYYSRRGWQLPENENGFDEGYLVEYLDGGFPNHPDHAGYISWSPKEVFDGAYVAMGEVDNLQPHQQRVVAEKVQLDDKLGKLVAFMDIETFANLDAEEKDRLKLQSIAMENYSTILAKRIAAFA